jgi:hypothetical protein
MLAKTPPLPGLINPKPAEPHPSYQAVNAMARAWQRAGGTVIEAEHPSRIGRKLLRRRARATATPEAVLLPLVGPATDWIPVFSAPQPRELYLFCWDVWPSNAPRWREIFEHLKPRKVFMTTSDAVRAWQSPAFHVEWMPDATDVSAFDPSKPLEDRSIDVLELGRKWNWLHTAITGPLKDRGARHLYQADETTVIFDNTKCFIEGMQDSKSVVCVPGSVTHPEKFGPAAVLTPRYLETMAAGAIPVGVCPPDLEEVMGYNPVIEIDRGRPLLAFENILDDPSAFSEVKERNRMVLEQKADWRVRIEELRYACAK